MIANFYPGYLMIASSLTQRRGFCRSGWRTSIFFQTPLVLTAQGECRPVRISLFLVPYLPVVVSVNFIGSHDIILKDVWLSAPIGAVAGLVCQEFLISSPARIRGGEPAKPFHGATIVSDELAKVLV